MIAVVAIAAGPEGKGLAALQVEGRPPRVYRVGDKVREYRLVSVVPGEARLSGADTVLVLRIGGHTP
jgi:hypothetical protein